MPSETNNEPDAFGVPRLLTTGCVAKILGVAPRTATKFVDSGELPGYRLPGSTDRRVPRDNFYAFCRRHNVPIGKIAPKRREVLLIGVELSRSRDLAERLGATSGRWAFTSAANAFEAGLIIGAGYTVAVIDSTTIGSHAAQSIALAIVTRAEFTGMQVLLLLTEDQSQKYLERVTIMTLPVSEQAIAQEIRRLVEELELNVLG